MLKKLLVVCIVFIVAVAPISYAGTSFEGEGNDLGEEVFTPTGYKAYSINYPGNVSVITEEDIKRSNAKYVYDLLRREDGIYVSDYTYAGKTVLVDMRGFGETGQRNVLVMVDGRRVNEIDIAGADWSQIPLENVERIEILRGSGSVLYGDNAAAGVINILTKKGKHGYHLNGGVDFGSYGYSNYYSRVSGADEFAAYNFFAKHENTDGYRLNGDYDSYDFFGSMDLKPTDYLEIGLSGGYHKDWYGLPAGLQRMEIDSFGYMGSTTPNDRAKVENTFFKISPKLALETDSQEHKIIMDVWGRKKRLDTTTWDNVFGGGATWDNSQIDSVGGTIKYLDTFFLNDIANNFVIGLDLFSAANRLLTVTPAWGTYNQLKITKNTLGIFVNNQVELFEFLIATGGFRQEWADYGFDQSENNGPYEGQTPDEQAFDLGVEYKYREKGGIYGRFSRSFRLPATDEFYSRWTGLNTGLKPQSSDTWEVGIKDNGWKYIKPKINIFWMKTRDEIFYDPTQGAFGNNWNYDRTKRFGIETAARSHPVEWAEMYISYTYLEALYDGGIFDGKKIPMVPENKIAWGVHLAPIENINIDFNSEYVSKQYSINDDNNAMPVLKPRFVCNGKLTFLYKGAKIYAGINNIFDVRYSEMAASNVAGTVTDFFPAPERNYVFGVSFEY